MRKLLVLFILNLSVLQASGGCSWAINSLRDTNDMLKEAYNNQWTQKIEDYQYWLSVDLKNVR